MAEFFEEITDKHAAFIAEQPVFFTATACSEGRINLSPKGMDCFRVLSPRLCGYLDMTGSGNETAAHIKNDGRITIMFNSFSRNALIYRIYGRGRVVRPQHPEFEGLKGNFPDLPGMRQIILIDVDSTQTSCGYAVPEMELKTERQTLKKYWETKGEEMDAYHARRNTISIDGLETGIGD